VTPRLVPPPTCPSQKIPYPTREAANVDLRDGRRRHGKNQYAYRCPKCPAWHLASNPAKRVRL